MKFLTPACLLALGLAPSLALADAKFGPTGLVIAPADDSYRLRFGGRLHFDSVRFNEDITKSVWVSYTGFKNLNLKAGQMTAPFGMEELASSNDTIFMERALPSALAPGLLVGAQGSYAWKHGTATLGYYGNPLNVEFGKTSATGRSLIGRATWAPLHSSRQTLHFGLAYEARDLDTGSAFRISSAPETGLTQLTLFNTSNLINARRMTRRGAEAAWALGPLTVQAEYMKSDLQREGFPDSDFDGWYVQAAWLLTGEHRSYRVSSGNFRELRPRHKFGALELALRRSALDLESGFVTGGRGWNESVGLNWYLGRNFRLMTDYTRSRALPNRNGLDETLAIFQVRAQVDY
ncbi:MAG: porin [Gammaproteobacteria bacterium]|nr:porin [Gammaproteobacteria bacterium]